MNVPEANLSGFYILVYDLTPRASGKTAAVRSLKIAELDNDDGGVFLSDEVPGLGNNNVFQAGRVRGSGGLRR